MTICSLNSLTRSLTKVSSLLLFFVIFLRWRNPTTARAAYKYWYAFYGILYLPLIFDLWNTLSPISGLRLFRCYVCQCDCLFFSCWLANHYEFNSKQQEGPCLLNSVDFAWWFKIQFVSLTNLTTNVVTSQYSLIQIFSSQLWKLLSILLIASLHFPFISVSRAVFSRSLGDFLYFCW